MLKIKQASTTRQLVFFMASSTDHVTGKTGLAPAVLISKNGGGFAAPAGVVTEVGNGFYKLAPAAGDTDTLGLLALSATGAGADQAAMAYEVVAYDSDNAASLGLSRIDENTSAPKAIAADEREFLATVVEAHLLNDGDSQMLINAIVAGIGNQNVDEAALVAAVRADLERVGGNLATLLLRATEARLAKLDVTGELAHADAAGNYRATGFATPLNVTDARDALLAPIAAIPAATTLAVHGAVVPGDYVDGSAGAALGRLNLTPAAQPVVVVPVPDEDASLCTVYVYTESLTNEKQAGIEIHFELPGVAAKSERFLARTKVTAVTDAEGFASITLQRTNTMTPNTLKYLVTCRELGLTKKALALTTELYNLAGLVA